MPIGPFSQPLQQEEFIPQTPDLPVTQIAKGAQRLNQRERAARDLMSRVQQNIAESSADPVNRDLLASRVQDYNRELENLAQQEDLLYDDTGKISSLASDFAREQQVFEQNKKNLEDTLKTIDENIPSETRRRALKRIARQNFRLDTDESGKVDPTSVTPSQSFGEEGNLAEIARGALSGLQERILKNKEGQSIRGSRINEDLGLIEFYKKTGVSADRMANAILTEYRNNPKIQNWVSHQARMYASRKGISREDARKMAKQDLAGTAKDIAENRSFENLDLSRRNMPDFMTPDGEGEEGSDTQAITYVGAAMPATQRYGKDSPQAKEEESFNRVVLRDSLKELGVSDNTVRKIQKTAQKGTFLQENPAPGPQSPHPGYSRPVDRIREMEETGEVPEGTAAKFENAVRNAPSFGGGESQPRWISPTLDGQNFNELENAVRSLPDQAFTNSPEVNAIVDSQYWFGDEGDKKEVARLAKANAADIDVNSEGTLMKISVAGNNEVPESVRGRNITVQIPEGSNFAERYADILENTGHKTQAQILRENKQARDSGLSVPYDQWKPISNNRAQLKRKRNGNIQVRYKDNQGRLRSPNIGSLVENVQTGEDINSVSNLVMNEVNKRLQDNSVIVDPELAKYGVIISRRNGSVPEGETGAKMNSRLNSYANQMGLTPEQLKKNLMQQVQSVMNVNPSFENIGPARKHAIQLANQAIDNNDES